MSSAVLLEAKELTKSFDLDGSSIDVLRGISCELAAGDTAALVGPSGSGKSTLLHLLGALDPPTSGSIRIDGQDPWSLSEKGLAQFRNAALGFVFQAHHLLPHYSVLENVLLPTFAHRLDAARGQAVEKRAEELIDRIGLGARRTHRPRELSGGERQRVAVARALINQPSIVLCDEPTGSLDHATAQSVADLLFELQSEANNILVLATHSLELAARCDRHFTLSEGRCSEA